GPTPRQRLTLAGTRAVAVLTPSTYSMRPGSPAHPSAHPLRPAENGGKAALHPVTATGANRAVTDCSSMCNAVRTHITAVGLAVPNLGALRQWSLPYRYCLRSGRKRACLSGSRCDQPHSSPPVARSDPPLAPASR